jgi:hypothetical protein
MTCPWSGDSIAAQLDQGVCRVLVAVGAFLSVLEELAGRPAK